MATIDINSRLYPSSAVDTILVNSNQNNVDGNTIDTKDFESVEFLMTIGLYNDGIFTFRMQDSDDGSSWSVVVLDDLIGNFGVIQGPGVARIGYRGKRRYVRLQWTSASVTTGATINATSLLGSARKAPTETTQSFQ